MQLLNHRNWLESEIVSEVYLNKFVLGIQAFVEESGLLVADIQDTSISNEI